MILTDREINSIAYDDDTSRGPVTFARAVEAAVIKKLVTVSVEATAWAHRETGLVVLASMTKQQLWHLIEQYRQSGGREEHWRNRDILDHAIDVALDDSLIASQAKRLALELECLLNDTQDMAKVSKWWDSAMEALQLYRDACSVAYSTEEV